jgi:hypothetical protein
MIELPKTPEARPRSSRRWRCKVRQGPSVAWTDFDNLLLTGNSVKFVDETDVRGRLGLRVGTSHVAKDGTVFL